MFYNSKDVTQSTLVECDQCRIQVELRSVFTEEQGNHFCLTCWLEKDPKRSFRRRLTIVES